jgi:hypothetical protein
MAPNLTITIINKKWLQVSGQCVITGEEYQVKVPREGFVSWTNGNVAIQTAMPQVSADDREFLLSGISPVGWERSFGIVDSISSKIIL